VRAEAHVPANCVDVRDQPELAEGEPPRLRVSIVVIY
jgi:hypothetical protein